MGKLCALSLWYSLMPPVSKVGVFVYQQELVFQVCRFNCCTMEQCAWWGLEVKVWVRLMRVNIKHVTIM